MAAATTFTGPDAFVPDINNPAQSWADYKTKFKIYATATKLSASDNDVQVANFLYFAGDTINNIYHTLHITVPAGEDLTLDLVFAEFDNYYAPYKNLIAAQFDLLTTKQIPHQTFADFLTIIKTKARRCELGPAESTLLCTIIAMGVLNDDLRKKILAKRTTTLQQVVEMCQSDEASSRHAKTLAPAKPFPMQAPSSDVTLDVLNRTFPTRHGSPYRARFPMYSATPRPRSYSPSPGHFSPPSRFARPPPPPSAALPHRPPYPRPHSYPASAPCRNCGTHHPYGACPAASSTCYSCQRRGHWASLCRSTRPTHELTMAQYSGPYFDHSDSAVPATTWDPATALPCYTDDSDAAFYQTASLHIPPVPSGSVSSISSLPDVSDLYLHSLTMTLYCDTTDHTDPYGEEWYDTAFLGNTPVSFKLDTGSQVNIIP